MVHQTEKELYRSAATALELAAQASGGVLIPAHIKQEAPLPQTESVSEEGR